MSEDDIDSENAFPEVTISARHALVTTAALAAVYGLIFVLFGQAHHTSMVDLVASLGLGSALLLLTYIDLRTGLLLDIITWPLVAFGLGYAAHAGTLYAALSGAVIGYGLIAGLSLIWLKNRGYPGIGLGDAKLLAAGGSWVGLFGLPMILLIASGTGILTAIIVAHSSRSRNERAAIAFGPHLAIAIWIVWCGMNIL